MKNNEISLKLLAILLWSISLTSQPLYSQYTSKDNYTGNWETSASWVPNWPMPEKNVSEYNIYINGHLTANGSLSFSGNKGDLFINDTLVIRGDLSLGDHNKLNIKNNGVLIILGNLYLNKKADIVANGYLIVTKNIVKTDDFDKGSLTSNDNPVKIFIGGTVPFGLTNNDDDYPALDCFDHNTVAYPGTGCSYGNLTDLIKDPINPFYQSICTLITPSITSSGPLSFCTGGNVTLTSSAGLKYSWSTGANTSNIIVSSSGSYTVKTTDIYECKSKASEATIVVVNNLPAQPQITASGSLIICAGDSVTLTSSAGTSYVWSTGETTQAIKVKTPGSYSVRVKNASGCESIASAVKEVVVNALPALPTISSAGSLTFCEGDSVRLTSSTGVSYLWSSGETTREIKVENAGNYSIKVKNANGCESLPSTIVKVTVNSLPAKPTITASGPVNFCSGNNVILASSASKNYLWSTGENTQNIKIENPGNYTVKVIDANGCESSISENIEIFVKPLPTTPVISASGPLTFCAGEKVTLTSSEGISYFWSTGEKTKGINVTNSGSFTVKVKNEDGCESAASLAMSVVVLDSPEVRFTNTNEPMCTIDSRPLTATPSGGVFSILNGPGSINSNVLTTSSSGTINLEYNYSGECANKSTQTILVNDQPVANSGSDQELKFVFETQMNSELLMNETGEWSLISGDAKITDIHSPTTRITGLSAGAYTLLWTVKNGVCISSSEVKILVYDVFIPSAITPNGDDRNDFFTIEPIIGKVELIIFNRWGNEEYRNFSYSNDWDGRNNEGKQLPDDTYFYVIKLENGKIKKGTVLIKSK